MRASSRSAMARCTSSAEMLAAASRVRAWRRRPPGDHGLTLQQERNRIHHTQHAVAVHAVALLQPEGEQSPADLRRHGHFGRLEVAVGIGLAAAAGDERGEK